MNEKTAIIGIRVCPAVKKRIVEEAQKRGETLTEFLSECILAGWNNIVRDNRVKQEEYVKQGREKLEGC